MNLFLEFTCFFRNQSGVEAEVKIEGVPEDREETEYFLVRASRIGKQLRINVSFTDPDPPISGTFLSESIG